jgi:hypothetical protein
MLNPIFPYKNNQIILSSQRILLDAKSDGIFLFGKQMVALASNGTVNIDAKERILIDSDKIELGHKAESLGNPVILGQKFVDEFNLLLEGIQFLAGKLSAVSKTGDADSWIMILEGGSNLYDACNRMMLIINNPEDPKYPLSKNTYTR